MSTLRASEIQMDDLLELAVQEGASDLHLAVGLPPIMRIHGSLAPLDAEPLRPEDTERLLHSFAPEHHIKLLDEQGGSDFGFGFGEMARFRVSIFRQKGHVGIVLRQIPSKMLTLEEIGLPPQTRDLLFKPRGLILVTGPTGSGKTTTLASMLNIINQERDCHIITIEDPVEYYHTHQKSVVTQREIGVDVPTFKEALRRALRQDPDVILVGEMRDLETMEAAITAAETGHLVLPRCTPPARRAPWIESWMPSRPTSRNRCARSCPPALWRLFLRFCCRARMSRAHRGIRNYDCHAFHSRADSRQQDVPDYPTCKPARSGACRHSTAICWNCGGPARFRMRIW